MLRKFSGVVLATAVFFSGAVTASASFDPAKSGSHVSGGKKKHPPRKGKKGQKHAHKKGAGKGVAKAKMHGKIKS